MSSPKLPEIIPHRISIGVMPNWNQLLDETRVMGSVYDVLRRRYLTEVHRVTGRNVIIYYSGWLQKGAIPGIEINDDDKNGFMTVIHKLDRDLGLDLVLHTPGGETSTTESLVNYLRSMFGTNIRAIVPQLAMSGGTMIACACKDILMGKQSSLGPIDPQLSGIPAHGVMEEFKEAEKAIKEDISAIPIWQPLIAKYPPAFIGECQKAIDWSNEMTREWLETGMFKNHKDAGQIIERILEELGDHALTKSHARQLAIDRCRDMGLKVSELEAHQELQEAVLSLHHACTLTLSSTPASKIIENQNGVAFIKMLNQPVIMQGPPGGKVGAPNRPVEKREQDAG